jgi:hypothetical protein
MIAIGGTLISEELLDKKFVCDLNACKGACCVKGDYGAPLEEEELTLLDKVYKKVRPYLSENGIQAIEEQGKYLKYSKKEWVTPLIKGKECAYTIFEKGVAKCGIEKAYFDGKIDFQKPVSCHLYPIRITKMKSGVEALNYDKWSICKAACKLGDTLKVPVFRFLKNGLVRKYGEKWFNELEVLSEELSKANVETSSKR